MSRADEIYKPALISRKLPILTLDNKWHKIFTQFAPDPRVKKLEEELNDLLKRQGKLTNEAKEIRRLKKRLMDEIVDYAEQLERGKDTSKKMADNTRLINECNEKLENDQNELLDLPAKIGAVNYQLMLLTMEICYQRIQENTTEIEEISQWITQIRVELKKKLIRKQEKEYKTNELYHYMHQIFGAEVIEIFDMKYVPELARVQTAAPDQTAPAKPPQEEWRFKEESEGE